MPKLERDFQASLIKELKDILPGCFVFKSDPNYIQGIPDLIVLWQDHWAVLECKRGSRSKRQPNQEYYVETLGKMSFAAFIDPTNKETVLGELQRAFGVGRRSRISQR